MPLYLKAGTSSLLRVGTSLASNSACCCAAPPTCNCTKYCNTCSPSLPSSITATWDKINLSNAAVTGTFGPCTAISSCVCIGSEVGNTTVTVTNVALVLSQCSNCSLAQYPVYRGISSAFHTESYDLCYKDASGCCSYVSVKKWYIAAEYEYTCVSGVYRWNFRARVVSVETVAAGQCTDNPSCDPFPSMDNTSYVTDFDCTTSLADWIDSIGLIPGIAASEATSFAYVGLIDVRTTNCVCDLPLSTVCQGAGDCLNFS